MDFSLTAEQEQIRAYGGRLAETYDRRYWQQCSLEKRFPVEMWRQIGQDGYLGLTIPLELGGAGRGMTETALLIESLAAEGFPLLLFVVGPGLGFSVLAQFGSEDQRRNLLPAICRGEKLMCFAITEAAVGSNTTNLETRAVAHGGGYQLSGSKDFTSGADVCDYALVVARTTAREEAPHKNAGFTLFLVPLDAPGVERTPMDIPLPLPECQCHLRFRDVELGMEHVVGEVDQGMLALAGGLNSERIAAAAMSCGLGRYMTEKGAAYARDRSVFSAPIGSHQAVQHPLARSRTQVELAWLMTLQAAWQVDHGAPADEAANMAKYASAEASMEAAESALQAHGGYGYTREAGIHDIYQVARLLRSAPVNRERALCFIAERSLRLPRSY